MGAAAHTKSLANIEALMEAMGHPERQFRSVHVAGTNGKGSSSHWLAAVLQAAGYNVGLYTSPHLREFTERLSADTLHNRAEQIVRAVVVLELRARREVQSARAY